MKLPKIFWKGTGILYFGLLALHSLGITVAYKRTFTPATEFRVTDTHRQLLTSQKPQATHRSSAQR